MSDTGISSRLDWPTLSRRLSEERQIHHRHSESLLQKLGYALYWQLYPPYKRYMSRRRGNKDAHRREGIGK